MKMIKLSYWLLLVVLIPFQIQAKSQQTRFDALLNEAGLTLTEPEHFSQRSVQNSDLLPYEHVIRHSDNVLEVRYAIRPISRMEINYQDPHSSAPEPNHIFTMMFTALIGQLSSGGNSPHREYSPQDAADKFNADWAGLSVFDIEQAYSADFKQAFLVALHKNNLADAYLVILFNDYKRAKPLVNEVIQSLRFK